MYMQYTYETTFVGDSVNKQQLSHLQCAVTFSKHILFVHIYSVVFPILLNSGTTGNPSKDITISMKTNSILGHVHKYVPTLTSSETTMNLHQHKSQQLQIAFTTC